MRGLLWRIAWRLTPKGFLTAAAIGVVTSAALLGFSLGEALRVEGIQADGPLASANPLVAADAAGPDDTLVHVIGIDDGVNPPMVLVFARGPDAPPVPADEAWSTEPIQRESLSLDGLSSALTIINVEHHPLIAPGWLAVSPDVGDRLSAGASWETSYALATTRATEVGEPSVPAIGAFVRASASEVARDLRLIVAFACVLTLLFSYEFIRSDIRERRSQLAIMRAMGMRRRELLRLMTQRGASVVAFAATLGVTLAAGLAAGVARFTPLTHAALPPPSTTAGVCAAVVLAGLVGSLYPAYRTSHMDIAHGLDASG